MNMLMIICPEERQEEVRELITNHDVHSYSEIPNVLGEGKTGKHFGTHTWPGTSVLVFTVVDETKKEELMKALKKYHDGLFESEGLRVFSLPVESEF